MNLSAAAMLVNSSIRPVRVDYDPDVKSHNYPDKFMKTLDPAIKKDDLVIVPTGTRYGFTIAKVVDIDFPVDFNSNEKWGWIGGKFDKDTMDEILETEKQIIARVGKAQENKMRKELAEAAGLGEVSFTDLDLMRTPALAAPRPVEQPAEAAPAPQPPTA